MKNQRFPWLKPACLGVLGTLSLLSPLWKSSGAQAQAAYGSYIGIGPSVSFTQDSNGNGSDLSGVLAVRYKMLKMPISLRTQIFVGSGTAIVPTVSYDVPINWQGDVYLGAGMSIPTGNSVTALGDQTTFVIQPGIDYALPKSQTVIFSNAVIAFDAYRNGGGSAFTIQGGVGQRF